MRVDLPDGTVIEYLVDGQNRRVAKLVNGITVKQWLWSSQLRIAAELDGSGNLVSRFVYGNKPTTPELVVQGSAVYRVISDHLGSVRALVNVDDVTDAPVRLDYGAFGEVSGVGVGVVPQGFAGGLYDAETGLVRFGARDYGPVTGRWTGKDPIVFHAGLPNLYSYGGSDPVNRSDPSGEDYDDACKAAVTIGCWRGCQKGRNQAIRSMCSFLCGAAGKYMLCSWKEPGDIQPDPGICEPLQQEKSREVECEPSVQSCTESLWNG